MKPQWAGPEHCGSLEATQGSLKAAPLGSTYAYGTLEHKRHGLHSQVHELRVRRCRILPQSHPVLGPQEQRLSVPPLPSPPIAQAWHVGEEHTDTHTTCLLHHIGLYLAAQPGQPGRW